MLDNTTRLYISPLTPDRLSTVLGPTLRTVAENISLHEIQTFPENSYGYVDLPTIDADRLKKKLGGAIFRGTKMKVEEARPKKRTRAEQEEEAPQADTVTKSHTKSKKQRTASRHDVIPGRELSPGRKVQRGWTEPKKEKISKRGSNKSQKQSSKYTEKAELLFRTKVPASKADTAAKISKKPRKAKHGAEERTVHEFQNTTTQPSFLKSDPSSSRLNLKYVNGRGWVDEAGEVVEGEPSSVRRTIQKLESQKNKAQSKAVRKSSARTCDSRPISASTTSESSLSSSSDDDTDEESADSSDMDSSLPQEDAATNVQTGTGETHPLESLFKKPQKPASQDVAKPSLEISTGFSFLRGGSDDIEDEPELPLTPFSQDTRTRGLRSAAPTPDTAHPSRFNSYDSARFIREDASEEEESASAAKEAQEQSPKQLPSGSKPNVGAGTSDFEKLFWEKRGDNNRAWKGRRRAVLKEKRHRDNRARRPKNW